MLLWAEPFEQYGGTLALISQSGYTDVGINGLVATGRTGGWKATCNNGGYLRRALNVPIGTVGMGVAFMPSITPPTNSTANCGMRWDSAGKTMECEVVQMPDLSLGVYDRTSTLKGTTPPNQLILNSWTWFEAVAIKNTAGVNTGQVEVRVNGVQKLVVNGINLPNDCAYHSIGGNNAGNFWFDDYIAWDNSGPYNNTFMGDRRLFVSYTNANGALQDFVPSAGAAWDCLNNSPPVDTTYIEGALAGNISEFQKDAIGVNSTDVAAIVIGGRLFKTDAGAASGRLGITSVGNTVNSVDIFPGTSGAFYYVAIERDPNGTIPWTKAAADLATARITRTL